MAGLLPDEDLLAIAAGRTPKAPAAPKVTISPASGLDGLHPELAHGFEQARQDLARQGIKIRVNEGKRTIPQQAARFAAYQAGGPVAAHPTPEAPHVRGVAIDIHAQGPGVTSAADPRVEAAFARYGIRRTVGSEPWHYELRGGAAAASPSLPSHPSGPVRLSDDELRAIAGSSGGRSPVAAPAPSSPPALPSGTAPQALPAGPLVNPATLSGGRPKPGSGAVRDLLGSTLHEAPAAAYGHPSAAIGTRAERAALAAQPTRTSKPVPQPLGPPTPAPELLKEQRHLLEIRKQLAATQAEGNRLNGILKQEPRDSPKAAVTYARLHGAPAGQAPAKGTVNARMLELRQKEQASLARIASLQPARTADPAARGAYDPALRHVVRPRDLGEWLGRYVGQRAAFGGAQQLEDQDLNTARDFMRQHPQFRPPHLGNTPAEVTRNEQHINRVMPAFDAFRDAILSRFDDATDLLKGRATLVAAPDPRHLTPDQLGHELRGLAQHTVAELSEDNLNAYLQQHGIRPTPIQRQAMRSALAFEASRLPNRPRVRGQQGLDVDTTIGATAIANLLVPGSGAVANIAKGGVIGAVQQPAMRAQVDPHATPQDLAGEAGMGLVGGIALGGLTELGGVGLKALRGVPGQIGARIAENQAAQAAERALEAAPRRPGPGHVAMEPVRPSGPLDLQYGRATPASEIRPGRTVRLLQQPDTDLQVLGVQKGRVKLQAPNGATFSAPVQHVRPSETFFNPGDRVQVQVRTANGPELVSGEFRGYQPNGRAVVKGPNGALVVDEARVSRAPRPAPAQRPTVTLETPATEPARPGAAAAPIVRPAEAPASTMVRTKAPPVNLDKFDLAPEHKQLLADALTENADALNAHRRGVRSIDVTDAEADRLIDSGELKLKPKPGTAFNAEEQRAVAKLLVRSVKEVSEAREAWKANDTPEAKAALAEATARFQSLLAASQGAQAEAGRALQALRATRAAYVDELTGRQLQTLFSEDAAPVVHRGGAAVKADPSMPEFGAGNQLFKKETAAAAIERLKQAAGRLNSGLDPTILPDLLHVGGYLLEGGARQFPHWAEAMRSHVGDWLTDEHLRDVWGRLKTEARNRLESTFTLGDQARRTLAKGMDLSPETRAALRKSGGAEYRAAVDALLPPELVKALDGAGNDPVALARVIRQHQRTRLADWLHGTQVGGLLLDPGLQAAKALSLAAHAAIQPAERLTRAGLDTVRAAVTRSPREHFAAEAFHGAAAYLHAIPQALRDYGFTLRHGMSAEAAARLEVPRELPGGLKNPLNLGPRHLSAIRSLFHTPAEHGELGAQAIRSALKEGLSGEAAHLRAAELRANPTEEMRTAAKRAADFMTFHGENGPGGVIKALEKARSAMTIPRDVPLIGGFQPLRAAVPFMRATAEIARVSGIDYSPAGAFRYAAKGNWNTPQGTIYLSRALVGTAAMAAIAPLVAAGRVTGDFPQDAAERKRWQELGLQPNSVKIGDRWVSVSHLGPLGSWFMTTARMVNDWHRHGQEPPAQRIIQAATSLGKGLVSGATHAGYFHGLADLVDLIRDPERNWEKFGARVVNGLVPASGMLRRAARAMDPYERKPANLGDYVKQNLPGLRQQVPLRTDRQRVPLGPALQVPRQEHETGLAPFLPLEVSKPTPSLARPRDVVITPQQKQEMEQQRRLLRSLGISIPGQ